MAYGMGSANEKKDALTLFRERLAFFLKMYAPSAFFFNAFWDWLQMSPASVRRRNLILLLVCLVPAIFRSSNMLSALQTVALPLYGAYALAYTGRRLALKQ